MKSRPRIDLLASRKGRRLLFAALYLSEGAPIGFIWWALPTILRASGHEIAAITEITALLVLPWVFKSLWSPLIDAVRSPRWGLRSWILSTQALMGCALLPLLFLDLTVHLFLLLPFLLIHAIAAATQDAAIDALAISSVPVEERGSVNGWMQAGMLVGRSALGGGALIMAGTLGTTAVIGLLIAVIWSTSALVLFSRESQPIPHLPDGRRTTDLILHLRIMFRSRITWIGLLFAATAGVGFEAVGAVAGTYLLDRGVSQILIGQFFAINAVIGMGAGAVLGGFMTDRWGTRKTVPAFLLLMFLCILLLPAAAAMGPGTEASWTLGALTALYVSIGLFTAASYTLFMQITDPALGATQFSAYMGATNLCESWATYAMGKAVPLMGYGPAFALMGMLSLATLPLVRHLRSGDAHGVTTGN